MNNFNKLRSAIMCLIFSALIQAQDSIPINQGMTGTWFNPDTPGQGLLFDVNDESKLFFAAWFTFLPESEPVIAPKTIGSEDHSWMTIQGLYTDDYVNNVATIPIFGTTGGIFDDNTETSSAEIGTFSVNFIDCNNGHIEYVFDSIEGGRSGGFDIQRLIPDSFCQLIFDSQKVTITYIGNEGVFVSNSVEGIFIDGVGSFGGMWNDVPASLQTSISNVEMPYDLAKALLVTHIHGDHFTASNVTNFINNSPQAQLIIPPAGRGNFVSLGGNVIDINLNQFDSTTQTMGNITVTTINTRHFNNPFNGTPFNLENYVYAINISGKTIVHFGDISYASDNLQAIADAVQTQVDVVILPTFTSNLVNQQNADLVQQFFPQALVVASHLQAGSQSDIDAINQFYPNAVIFDQPLESLEL